MQSEFDILSIDCLMRLKNETKQWLSKHQ